MSKASHDRASAEKMPDLFLALEDLEREKHISKEYMLERIEAALVSAYKHENGNANVRVEISEEKSEIHVYQQFTVVEEVTDPVIEISLEDAKKRSKKYVLGDTVEVELKPKNFRRLSAQAAKQVIIQGIREEERKHVRSEYETKREEIVTAQVVKVDDSDGSVVVDTGTSEAVLIKDEQIPGETFEVGDRIKVYISEVRSESRGPIVILSRTHPSLVKRLFELEIPEIADGTVVIKGICREAGSRTKIAVMSTDENVDAVGSCIGSRGSRISAILDELRGEKIDIVKYSEDPAEYISAALAPATVNEVYMEEERSAKVYVDSEQLSLAIGKEGQNARLAARLTGYKIDIKGT
ncbi:MAG: transcription termination factor NusA [Clostridiales bacterium]|nr:transcription termination factor NusA [Clostridiales bacterium]